MKLYTHEGVVFTVFAGRDEGADLGRCPDCGERLDDYDVASGRGLCVPCALAASIEQTRRVSA